MRILSRMVQGDNAWEVPGKNFFSQFKDITEPGRSIVTLHETRIGPARHVRAGETGRRLA